MAEAAAARDRGGVGDRPRLLDALQVVEGQLGGGLLAHLRVGVRVGVRLRLRVRVRVRLRLRLRIGLG